MTILGRFAPPCKYPKFEDKQCINIEDRSKGLKCGQISNKIVRTMEVAAPLLCCGGDDNDNDDGEITSEAARLI